MTKSFFLSILCLCLLVPTLFAQVTPCDCFDTQLVRARDTTNEGRYYEFEVTARDNCPAKLRSFFLGLECGTVTQAWNSMGKSIDRHYQHPQNDLWGLKVGDLGSNPLADTFKLGFILTPENAVCTEIQSYWKPVVAYQTASCVEFKTLDLSYLPGLTPKMKVEPTSKSGVYDLSFTMPGKGHASVEIQDTFGNPLMLLFDERINRQQRLTRQVDLNGFTPGLYLYHVHTNYGQSSGKIWVR